MAALAILYLGASLWLAIYGFNAFWLIWLYLTHRRPPPVCATPTDYPTVTVQLPVYNERYVVCRAIGALASLDWPRDRLQVQVVDDSTDDTADIVAHHIALHQALGVDIAHVRRSERSGFKAGALNAALTQARGEYIALFDADFAPQPDFLARTVPLLAADPGLAFVQARWGHLNRTFSNLTLAQAIALDGHFAIEHVARERAGMLTSFNGTAGVWRRQAIDDCGGWDPEQLTEDVDLSYRAQLRGWRGRTLPELAALAEIPAQMTALKRQQSRWAKGNIQCLLKLGPAVIRSPLSWTVRLQALIHLSYYLAHPLMLIVMLVALPLVWHGSLDRWPLAALSVGTLGPPLLYALGQRVLYGGWWRSLRAFPALICIGVGMALNSTIAIVEVLLGVRSTFLRTPKGGIGAPAHPTYALRPGRLLWAELALALYAALTIAIALQRGYGGIVPFQALYVLGFGYVSLLELVQAHKSGSPPRAQSTTSA
ncbi:MAG: glycosyltransferase [Anaerolineae bacterium]|nr:glycosyltransferase [Anaerolineae bacterium]